MVRAVLGQLGVKVKSKDRVKGAVYHKGGTRVVVDRPIVTDGDLAHYWPDIAVLQSDHDQGGSGLGPHCHGAVA